jgi:hypothetical protein
VRGLLYVADTGNHCIRRIALATGQMTIFAGSGSPGDRDGAGNAAQFRFRPDWRSMRPVRSR